MALRKHSVSIRGHQTSFSLEDEFWQQFKMIAKTEDKPVAKLITEIDENRPPEQNLSSALRLYVLYSLLEKAGSDSDSD